MSDESELNQITGFDVESLLERARQTIRDGLYREDTVDGIQVRLVMLELRSVRNALVRYLNRLSRRNVTQSELQQEVNVTMQFIDKYYGELRDIDVKIQIRDAERMADQRLRNEWNARRRPLEDIQTELNQLIERVEDYMSGPPNEVHRLDPSLGPPPNRQTQIKVVYQVCSRLVQLMDDLESNKNTLGNDFMRAMPQPVLERTGILQDIQVYNEVLTAARIQQMRLRTGLQQMGANFH